MQLLVAESWMQTKERHWEDRRRDERKKEEKGKQEECLLSPIGLSVLHSPFLSTVDFVEKSWSGENFWTQLPLGQHSLQANLNPNIINLCVISARSTGSGKLFDFPIHTHAFEILQCILHVLVWSKGPARNCFLLSGKSMSAVDYNKDINGDRMFLREGARADVRREERREREGKEAKQRWKK